MRTWVALLRAVNVGGTGVLAMSELRSLAEGCGLVHVRSYIQSGNLVFDTGLVEHQMRDVLERAVAGHLGFSVDVIVRSSDELAAIVEANPFADAAGSRVAVVLGRDPLPDSLLDDIFAPGGEEVCAGEREVYVHYPNGMGRSKLKLPTTWAPVTMRNMNTVTKLAAMAGELA